MAEIDDLIERSSLGTDAAKQLRSRTPAAVVDRIMEGVAKMDHEQQMEDAAALDQIAAALGLYTTDPGNNPVEELLTTVIDYVQRTGRRTDVPEGA